VKGHCYRVVVFYDTFQLRHVLFITYDKQIIPRKQMYLLCLCVTAKGKICASQDICHVLYVMAYTCCQISVNKNQVHWFQWSSVLVLEIFPVVIEIFCGFFVICGQILGWNSQVGHISHLPDHVHCPFTLYLKMISQSISVCMCVCARACGRMCACVREIYWLIDR
jgi:hypothetical protein